MKEPRSLNSPSNFFPFPPPFFFLFLTQPRDEPNPFVLGGNDTPCTLSAGSWAEYFVQDL